MDTAQEDLADWRSRLMQALKAFGHAVDTAKSAGEAVRLDKTIRALEQEGQIRGFLLYDGMCKEVDGGRGGHAAVQVGHPR